MNSASGLAIKLIMCATSLGSPWRLTHCLPTIVSKRGCDPSGEAPAFHVLSVRIRLGETTFAVTPVPASIAVERVKAATALFEAAYTDRPATGEYIVEDAVLIIRP